MKSRKMFYDASPWTFNRARQLRSALTPSEVLLWEFLKGPPCGFKFRRQHPIGDFIVDFFCFKARLVVEVDGPIHQDLEVQKKDKTRQESIIKHGLTIIRFSNEEVNSRFEEVKERIVSFLNQFKSSQNNPRPYPRP